MESWRKVFREGLAPLLSVEHLLEMQRALVEDDPKLLQGATSTPPPLQCVQDWPVEAACITGVCGVVDHGGWGEAKVADVEETFARLCYETDQRIGEPAGCRWFLNFWDETPRAEAIAAVLPEVERALAEKLSCEQSN